MLFNLLNHLLFFTNGTVFSTGTSMLLDSPVSFTTFVAIHFPRCAQQHCFKYRQGTLFSCPPSDMYSTTTLVEYEAHEKINVTEQAWERRAVLGVEMQSLPAAARRVKQLMGEEMRYLR